MCTNLFLHHNNAFVFIHKRLCFLLHKTAVPPNSLSQRSKPRMHEPLVVNFLIWRGTFRVSNMRQSILIYYLFPNIYTYISELFFIVVTCVLSNISVNLWVHAHLSKCWRGTWSEKGLESLSKINHNYRCFISKAVFTELMSIKLPQDCLASRDSCRKKNLILNPILSNVKQWWC